jgi:hypothetical protein
MPRALHRSADGQKDLGLMSEIALVAGRRPGVEASCPGTCPAADRPSTRVTNLDLLQMPDHDPLSEHVEDGRFRPSDRAFI